MKSFTKKLLTTLAGAAIAFSFSTYAAESTKENKVLRIGYQKYGTLIILKARGWLEERLAPQGIEVKWTEFPAGPQLLEGLNVGSVDFGTTGEAPPIFAQAAGAQLVYVGNEPPAPAGEAIVVPSNSTIKTVAELKGKKVALNKGSNVHYLLVKAIEKAGLQYKDVDVVYLTPSDARAAFERGSVDAWVIWDPFLAAAEKQINARILADGKGLVANHQFYLASKSYAEKNPQTISAIHEELKRIDDWAKKNPKEVAAFLAPHIGLDVAIVELAANRFSYGVQYISADVITAQQKIADTFHSLNLIPKQLNIKEAIWQPAGAPKVAQQKQ